MKKYVFMLSVISYASSSFAMDEIFQDYQKIFAHKCLQVDSLATKVMSLEGQTDLKENMFDQVNGLRELCKKNPPIKETFSPVMKALHSKHFKELVNNHSRVEQKIAEYEK